MEVIDELLSPRGGVRREDVDGLLDLRYHLHQAKSAETVLRIFCELRVRMEKRHYLAFFRIRRWLENHVLGMVQLCPKAEARPVPISLNFYCVEAIRRATLCAAGRQGPLLAPRLTFAFRHAPVAVTPAAVRSQAVEQPA